MNEKPTEQNHNNIDNTDLSDILSMFFTNQNNENVADILTKININLKNISDKYLTESNKN